MTNKKLMKAVGLYKALPIDQPDALVDIQVPIPSVGPHDLLVQVEAVAVNPADYRTRMRKEDDGTHAILGWDVAGTVLEVGAQVCAEFRPGDAVYYAGDLMRPGANSELHAVDARIVGHRPRSVSVAQAAAIPLTALTAWEALFDRLGLTLQADAQVPRSLLIVGGAGGVGSMAIQLAKQVPGLHVVATASRPESSAWCLKLGADAVIDHFGDMPQQLADMDLPAIDMVLLANDPDRHFPAAAQVLAPQGRICSIVPFDNPPDINVLMRKSAMLAWEFMFTRSMFGTQDMAAQRQILNQVAQWIDAGRIVSTASESLGRINAHNVRQAHALLETGRTIGKLTLTGF